MRILASINVKAARLVLLGGLVLASVLFIVYTGDGDAAAFAPKDNIPVYSVKTSGMQVAITLDAAWGSDKTAQILDILDEYDVKVTYFVTGMWARKNEQALRAIADRGHEIGSHSYSHKDYANLSDDQIREDLKKTDEVFESIIGRKPAIFRAPYGSWNARIVDAVCGEEYDFIQWDVDSLDWKGLTAQAMEKRIFSKVQSGSIMLFHNDAEHILEALPLIIGRLQAEGYKPVTVTELLGESLEAVKNEE